jgi:hypothetical protein
LGSLEYSTEVWTTTARCSIYRKCLFMFMAYLISVSQTI